MPSSDVDLLLPVAFPQGLCGWFDRRLEVFRIEIDTLGIHDPFASIVLADIDVEVVPHLLLGMEVLARDVLSLRVFD